jgi:hypothetical protein
MVHRSIQMVHCNHLSFRLSSAPATVAPGVADAEGGGDG